MQTRLLVFALAALTMACSDAPTAALLQPVEARFGEWEDDPPPPWITNAGDGATESGAFSYTGNFLVNPPGNVAWLNFTGGVNVKFSQGARLLSVNGNVSGVGTMTVGGTTYKLSSVESFEYDATCTTNRAVSCASFSGDGFSSSQSFWTGEVANDGRNGKGKPGDGDDDEGCITCVVIDDPKGPGR